MSICLFHNFESSYGKVTNRLHCLFEHAIIDEIPQLLDNLKIA